MEKINNIFVVPSRESSESAIQNLNFDKVDFFATGNEYFRDVLNFKFIPCAYKDKSTSCGGINLSDDEQDLQKSYSIARKIFENVEHGKIKFVLIGLEPASFLSDKKNVQILKDYIKLCLNNGAQPIGTILPVSSTVKKTFDDKNLDDFRKIIRQLEESCDFFCIDMLDLNLGRECFSDMTHLNLKGIMSANAFLALKLYMNKLIPVENFCDMSYEYFNLLSLIALKDDYNALMERVFNASAQIISRKNKIKVGFVLYDSSIWCGDKLYNYFAQDDRFEVTIFLCLRTDKFSLELIQRAFLYSINQFKSRGLNVVAVKNPIAAIPTQDILIFLTPYFGILPTAFRPENITAKTLTAYIPYGFSISNYQISNSVMTRVVWRFFFTSSFVFEMYTKLCRVGMPRGLYGGYPKADPFFDKKINFHFDWKMLRPDAKKIIYAPHWSINSSISHATFQWNCRFMYEFAKAHKEISWVFKPHPNLFFSAVRDKVFPSPEAFKEYLQAWNNLPNARLCMGTYYQDIFGTSDGMIHDCASFVAEYQFVNKPMIFLTRQGEKFNEIGDAILKTSYLVDGKDFEGIAALIQKVFVEGDDFKSAERKKVFDKYLNYPKHIGMSASEFIYKSIVDELN